MGERLNIPPFNYRVAISSLTHGSSTRKSDCSNELEIVGPNRGTRFICIALLTGSIFFKHYRACTLNASCPLKAYQKANGR